LPVSVVIPVYRRQKEAVEAIRSVLAQTELPLEIIIVDDGSPAPFELPHDLLANTAIRLVRLSENGGAARARNAGIALVRGDWIAFLDSDDLWLPEKLAQQMDMIRRDGTITMLASGFRQIDLASGETRLRIPLASSAVGDFASGCWFAPGSTTLVRTDVMRHVGGYDETLPRLEDLDLFLRLCLAGHGLAVTEAILVDVRVGRRPNVEALAQSAALLRDKWIEPSGHGQGLSRRGKRLLSAYLHLELAAVTRSAGLWPSFMKHLALSWLLVPRTSVHLQRWWG
jgi:glycosyltransferase involved in cell wall biosynthesis